jgi:hypothetical protein
MGVFTRNIVVEIITGSDLPFRVFRLFEFHLGRKDSGTFVRCEEGFRFNGTSMPVGTRWLISPSDLNLLQCAGAHDKVFSDGFLLVTANGQEYRHRISRTVANTLMLEMMQAKKVRKWKQAVITTGLALGSRSTWKKCRNADKR